MSGAGDARSAALAPLRAALLARADAEADRLVEAAQADAQQTLAEARQQAAALQAEAEERGEADARALVTIERARARRAARAIVLEAQRADYDELRRRACLAVRALLERPAPRARLAASLHRRLGERAAVLEHPDGGLVGEAPDGRRIDASVGALVDSALAGFDAEQLWSVS